jgi:hypothetical protein
MLYPFENQTGNGNLLDEIPSPRGEIGEKMSLDSSSSSSDKRDFFVGSSRAMCRFQRGSDNYEKQLKK